MDGTPGVFLVDYTGIGELLVDKQSEFVGRLTYLAPSIPLTSRSDTRG